MSSDAFHRFRQNTIGYNHPFESPYGRLRMVYADWTATGRLYRPLEEALLAKFAPFMANTHSQTSVTGSIMSEAYHYASNFIKSPVGPYVDDIKMREDGGTPGILQLIKAALALMVKDELLAVNMLHRE